MSDSKIQAARTIPAVSALPWASSEEPPEEGIAQPRSEGGLIGLDSDGLIDLASLSLRDRQLQWRDMAVATAVRAVARRIVTTWGSKLEVPSAESTAWVSGRYEEGNVAPNAETKSLTISLVAPVRRGTLLVTVTLVDSSDVTTTETYSDDSLGHITRSGQLDYGVIDYATGRCLLQWNTAGPTPVNVALAWNEIKPIEAYSGDLDADQGSYQFGGWTGVDHVKSSDLASEILRPDKHLYRRDLILYQVLSTADAIFVNLDGSSSNTVPVCLDSGAVIGDGWSLAKGVETPSLPGFGERWGIDTWKNADRYLAWRDNVLARAIAEISHLLSNTLTGETAYLAISTEEEDADILVEDDNDEPDEDLPEDRPLAEVYSEPESRSLLPEDPVWKNRYRGYLTAYDWASRLGVRVSDSDVEQYLRESDSGDATVLAVVGNHAADVSGIDISATAAMVARWDPAALVLLGSTARLGSQEARVAYTAPYADFLTRELIYPVVGPEDYAGETDLTEFSDYFSVPGNGRYYRKSISSTVEIFVLHAGWVATVVAGAVGNADFETTLEPDGNDQESVQALWLKAALADSTATWKLVFVHFPPYVSSTNDTAYASNAYPGYPRLRWPFKSWGASALITGQLGAYERVNVDGFPYVMSGHSAELVNTFGDDAALGSITRKSGVNGALRITATASWIRFDAYDNSRVEATEVFDSFTIWQDPTRSGYQRVGWSRQQLSTSSEINSSGEVFRWSDAEYIVADGGSRIVCRRPKQEPEQYILVSETGRYRKWRAKNLLPGGAKTLTWDRSLSTIVWDGPELGIVHQPRESTATFEGVRSTQVVEVLPLAPVDDCETLRSKAAAANLSPVHQRLIASCFTPRPVVVDAELGLVDSGSGYATRSETNGTTSSQAIFAAEGSVTWPELSLEDVPLATEPSQSWIGLVAMLEVPREWWIAGSDYSSADSIGATVVGTGLRLAGPGPDNQASLPTNVPYATWKFKLPAGQYKLQWEWTDDNAEDHDDWSVTVRWGDAPVFAGRWEGTTGSHRSAEVSVTATTETSQVTITLNGPVTLVDGITISRLAVKPLAVTGSSQFQLKASFASQTGFSELPHHTFNLELPFGTPQTAAVLWIDAALLDGRTTLSPKIQLTAAGRVPLLVRGINLVTRFKVDCHAEPGHERLLSTFLSQASSSVQRSWIRGLADAAPTYTVSSTKYWNEDGVADWLRRIAHDEPRARLAFRDPDLLDVGRPALVPNGVYYSGGSVKVTENATLVPTLRPLEPWMIDYKFPVASEDFSVFDRPPRVAYLAWYDPTGEDAAPVYDESDYLGLGFDRERSSQYLVLI